MDSHKELVTGSQFITAPSEEWIKCSFQSKQQIADLFIAFKTPLSSKVELKPKCRFTPKSFLNSFKIKGARIGLWIDTTEQNNFYGIDEVVKEGTRYEKLRCEEAEIPPDEVVLKFNELCRDFIKLRKPLEYVGVHCSLGYNLSGYLICTFLIEHMRFTLDSALAEFSKCRPNGIYNQNLLSDLFRKYGNNKHYCDIPMLPPKWKSAVDWEKKKNHVPKFVDGILGVEPIQNPEILVKLQRKIQNICKWTSGGFPGRTVVTLNSDNIMLLKRRPYLISAKADGRRYMMFIQGKFEIYFVDGENHFFQLLQNFDFPFINGGHLIDTLIDGEIVVDKCGRAMFIMFDIISFDGQSVTVLPFVERFQFIKDIMKHQVDSKIPSDNVQMIMADMRSVSGIGKLLDEELNMDYETDGLILMPADYPYECGSCDFILKWKPHELSTVDFLLKIEESGTDDNPIKIGQLYVGRLDSPLGQIELNSELEELDGKIIECLHENSKWKFLRHRTERVSPNFYNTAMEVITSILDPVTKEDLLKFTNQIDESLIINLNSH